MLGNAPSPMIYYQESKKKRRECWTSYWSLYIIHVQRITGLPTLIVCVTKPRCYNRHSIFLRIVKNRSTFCVDSSGTLGLYINLPAAVTHTRTNLHETTPTISFMMRALSYWSMFEFLAHDFLKLSCTDHSVFDTLFSSFYHRVYHSKSSDGPDTPYTCTCM